MTHLGSMCAEVACSRTFCTAPNSFKFCPGGLTDTCGRWPGDAIWRMGKVGIELAWGPLALAG